MMIFTLHWTLIIYGVLMFLRYKVILKSYVFTLQRASCDCHILTYVFNLIKVPPCEFHMELPFKEYIFQNLFVSTYTYVTDNAVYIYHGRQGV